jgi:hypothetical protein
MRKLLLSAGMGVVATLTLAGQPKAPALTAANADKFARLALACVDKEYPNKIAHVLNSPADVKAPHELTPAFFGCYDWHSSVHGHWMLAALARRFPTAPFAKDAIAALKRHITIGNIAGVSGERAYLSGAGRETFERPYGLAWLLQLASELREWSTDPSAGASAKADGTQLANSLSPLEDAVVDRFNAWLPKLAYPIREGEHAQTAFAFGMTLDYARARKNQKLEQLLVSKIREFHLKDRNCPINYEPSGQDFLSPCLAEADVMRRVLPPQEFAVWLTAFLPGIPKAGGAAWLPIGVVTDKSDGKLAHLDGLNLSRAWMLNGISAGLPAADPRRKALDAAAKAHADSGLAAVTGEHYEGGHWLGSFATYLLTR